MKLTTAIVLEPGVCKEYHSEITNKPSFEMTLQLDIGWVRFIRTLAIVKGNKSLNLVWFK